MRDKRLNRRLAPLALLLLTWLPTAGAGDWDSLSEAEQKVLAPFAPPVSSRSMAVPPAQVNHTKHISEGTIIAPRTNSRTDRPREIRARNSPPKGAKAPHQAQ